MLGARRHSLSKLKPFIISSISPLRRSPLPFSYPSSQPQIPSPSFPRLNPTKPFSFYFSFSRPFFSIPPVEVVEEEEEKDKKRPTIKISLCREGNYADEEEEEKEKPSSISTNDVCPGCGVHMQCVDSKTPGFFIKPSTEKIALKLSSHARLWPGPLESEFSDSLKRGVIIEDTEENLEEPEEPEKPEHHQHHRPVVCARCHSLRYYGRVKNPEVENLLPEFDFDYTIGRKISSLASGGARSVILAVVDVCDFDGSFPRKAAKMVSDAEEKFSTAWKEGKPGNVPRLILVATKVDLLPTSVSPTRLERWLRERAHEGGGYFGKIAAVHMVSSVRGWGIANLVESVAAMAGPRGRVWAVGAQNVGKSTLINAMAKFGGEIEEGEGEGEGKGKASYLTEAPVPGTTLGIVRVEGVFPGKKTKLFDTPGLLHPHQIATRLTSEEHRLVNMKKELMPRTYRITAGQSVHIAGLMRLDIEKLSVDTLYVTVWASVYLPLHMGKTENAHEMYDEHFGHQLQPPIGPERVKELGEWVKKEFRVSGNNWDTSSVDIAGAGIGWFAIGLKGEAVLGVWTYEGIEVVHRKSLILDRARFFQVAGFAVSKIVSKADRIMSKRKLLEVAPTDTLSLKNSTRSGKKKLKDPEETSKTEKPTSSLSPRAEKKLSYLNQTGKKKRSELRQRGKRKLSDTSQRGKKKLKDLIETSQTENPSLPTNE